MPTWVSAGFQDYAHRLAPRCSLHLIEIPVSKRTKQGSVNQCRREEAGRIIAALPPRSQVIALAETGTLLSTSEWATHLAHGRQNGHDVTFLIGGPDGLDPVCMARADRIWSLSRLTFPHALVRILVAEQLYRALTLLENHPYHRA